MSAKIISIKERKLTYEKNIQYYFNDGNIDRNSLSEFDSNNTELLTVEQVKEKLLNIDYIRDELAKKEGNN